LAPAQIWQFILQNFENYDNIIIAGHQPYLGIISGRFLFGAGIHIDAASFIAMEFKDYLPTDIEQGFAKEITP